MKHDISCLDESECLLAKPDGNNFLPSANEVASCWGCYLHEDTNKDVWIRSGSTTGEGGFDGCLHTHEARARSDRNDDDSRFYHEYPSELSARSSNKAKRGLFEYLKPHIAFFFHKDLASTGKFSKDYDDGGLFLYTEDNLDFIRRTSFSGKVGEHKFMQMVAYEFELGYDLALAIGLNISRSPVFEGCGMLQCPREEFV